MDCDTLLLTVSPTATWHPPEKRKKDVHDAETKSARASESRAATEKPIGGERAAEAAAEGAV